MTERLHLEIVWHPGRVGGAPTVGHSRITAENLAGQVWAGDDIKQLAEDLELTTVQVELACWWLALHSDRTVYRQRWHQRARREWEAWATAWGMWAWTRDGRHPHPGPPGAEEPRPGGRRRGRMDGQISTPSPKGCENG